MLRKDIQIGLSIGGVLLAVLIVYGVVASHSRKSNKAVVLDKSGTTHTGDQAPGGTGSDIPPADRPAVADEPKGNGATGATGGATALKPGGTADSRSGSAATTGDAGESPSAANSDKKETNWAALLLADKPEEIAKSQTPPLAADNHASVVDTAGATGVGSSGNGSSTGITGSGVSGNSSVVNPGNIAGTTTPPTESGSATTTPPTTRPSNSGGQSHTVQRGETFSSISKAAYGDARYYRQIAAANPTVNPNRLRPGTTIMLPDISSVQKSSPSSAAHNESRSGAAEGASSSSSTTPVDARSQYRVVKGDSLYKISVRLYGSPEEFDHIYALNKTAIGSDPGKLKLGMVLTLPAPPTATASR